jgi:hypothetical protein
MRGRTNVRCGKSRETQLRSIRDLMLAAARSGSWLTLREIAGLTEVGEASVSAQLRHLRKRRHGCHLVEKRRRSVRFVPAGSARGARRIPRRRMLAEPRMWEYRVLPRG